MTLRSSGPPAAVFFVLFTISGFAGLIYESIWSHYLKLFLGHAAYAQTLVLAIFMGGMALGSWLVSRFTHRLRNLLLAYAAAEFMIGVMALLFHRVFVAATAWSFDTVLPVLGASGGVDLFKWSLASALILPASILLGTTFPLMSGGIIRVYPGSSGRALSMLYFTNSFGAAAGVLASGFVLIDRVGLPGTILTAGLLNVALALVVWALSKRLPAPTAASEPARAWPTGSSARFDRVILVLALATGAASFIYEITWIRMLSLGLGASTHSFEVMLAAFILGMSAGAFWLRHRLQAIENHVVWLAVVLLAKAAFAIAAIAVYAEVLDFVAWMMRATARTDEAYALATFAGWLASMGLMFPTAFCAGMTLPLATHALTTRGHGEAAIGRVYGANTAGCIIGAAFATHLGMESLGVKGLTGAGAALDAAMGCLVLAASGILAGRRAATATLAAIMLGGAIAFGSMHLDQLRMASGVFRYGTFVDAQLGKIPFYRDGKTATIAVVDVKSSRTIRTNGKPDAGVELDPKQSVTVDELTMALLAALPLATRPDAALVANIGFGSGITTHGLLGSPRVKRVDTIEIEPAMIAGAKLFQPLNARAFSDPRSHIHIEDAKTFFAAHPTRYDVIVSEPSNPWVSGVSTLFSEEFYGQVKRHLADDGVLVQWIHAYELDLPLLSSIFAALGRHFPDYAVYTWISGDLYVIASPRGALPPLDPAVFKLPGVAADLDRLGIRSLEDLQALRVGGKRVLAPLFASTGMPANSDFFPLLDQRAPRARFRSDQVFELGDMRDALEPIMAMLDGEVRLPRATIRTEGRTVPKRYMRGAAAAEVIDLFTGAGSQAQRIPPAPLANVLAARALLGGCENLEAAWVRQLSEVVRETSPVLAAEDVKPVFAAVRASACWKRLGEADRRRVALLESINARDPAAMREHADHLLATVAKDDPQRSQYALLALTGALASGGPKQRGLLEQYAREFSPRDRERLIVRFALAQALAAAR